MNDIKDFIIVKNNFFEKKIYNEILLDISNLKFENRSWAIHNRNKEKDNVYQKIYFSVLLNPNHFAVKEVKKNLKKLLNIKTSDSESNYFLSTKHKGATPHFDGCQINCLVYLKGKELMNSGTAFYKYDKEKNEYIPNLNVGFKENRAIIFDSKIYHASLQFNEDCALRYVMANFFNYEE